MVAAGSITVAGIIPLLSLSCPADETVAIVRVRPPTSWEAARLPEPCFDTTIRGDGALSTPGRSVANTTSLREVVQIVDDRILTFDPDEKDRTKAFLERGFMPPGSKRYKDRRFMFDKVFNHEARQQDVYEGTAQPLLKGLLDGYNATVFAYGVRLLLYSFLYSSHALCIRPLAVARRTLSVEPSPTQESFISQWPIYFNVSKIAGMNGT